MLAIVDTDALLGLANAQDALHERAVYCSEKLLAANMELVLLPTTLGEFATLATRRIGMSQAKEVIRNLAAADYVPIELSDELTHQAVSLYQRQTSKGDSLFDCFVMVAAWEIQATCIFSFDRVYKKNGLVLVEEYFGESR